MRCNLAHFLITMDHSRAASLSGDDCAIPEDIRCKRSDGKQWRCSAMSMPDKTVCEKHYIQAKKRAANSAMRASIKKARRKHSSDSEHIVESRDDDLDLPLSSVKDGTFSRVSSKKFKKKKIKNVVEYSPETLQRRKFPSSLGADDGSEVEVPADEDSQIYRTPPTSGTVSSCSRSERSMDDEEEDDATDCSNRSLDSSEETGGECCHQCLRNDGGNVIWCLRCGRRGYCSYCISTWYADFSLEEIQRVCPACRGICYCSVCLRVDNLIKARIREISVHDKLQHLYSLLSSVLPVVKWVHHIQCLEVELEKRLCGIVTDLGRMKLNAEEQMCCDFCRTPIIDYHRHCANCSYDLCLACCNDLRKSARVDFSCDLTNENGINQETGTAQGKVKYFASSIYSLEKYPDWRANNDGSVPCPPKRYGGCGCLSLTLRRIFKMNWIAKLAKNVDELVGGCKACDEDDLMENASMSSNKLCQFSNRQDSDDNFIYCPTCNDIKSDSGIREFRKHWRKVAPIIVRQVCDTSVLPSWEPGAIWQSIQESADENARENNPIVKAIDCLSGSEVEIELHQFIKGFSEGRIHENGWPEILKLKDWPSPSSSEEYILYRRTDFVTKLPLLEYIHSKWGVLNVAARLPNYSLQNDAGPKILISYGIFEELDRGDAVINLHFSMRDVVYLLVHTSKMKIDNAERVDTEKMQRSFKGVDLQGSSISHESIFNQQKLCDSYDDIFSMRHEYGAHLEAKCERNGDDTFFTVPTPERTEDQEFSYYVHEGNSDQTCSGALWDVFRCDDAQKLHEYLMLHWEEFSKPVGLQNASMESPLYDEIFYIDMHHKRKLEEEFGVQPWCFEQHLGQAVFIPAGCPFQVRNLQSNVHLVMDFLSPESVGVAARMAEEIRCLPNDHEAKLHILEVGKMSLYAASSAIKDVQKLVLDPKFGAELGFEDVNLTTKVSENLDIVTRGSQATCV